MSEARSALLRPLPLAAVAVLLVNDHYAKRAFHNAVTGKLSDVAGMVFFPVFLWALTAILRPVRADAPRRLLLLSVATACVFALVKTWIPANLAYAWGLGTLQWPFRAARALLNGHGALPHVLPAPTVRDATDLLALPFAFAAYALRAVAAARGGAPRAALLRGSPDGGFAPAGR